MYRTFLGLFLLLVLAVNGRAQTTEEYTAYNIAIKEMEYAQRLIKQGQSLSSTPDMRGLDRTTDNSALRKRGQDQVANGKSLAASAQLKIKRFQERQAELRAIVSNKDRLVELTSSDGRKGVFAIESIALPNLVLVREDLSVSTININYLAKESRDMLIERLEPRVEFVCDTTYGAHYFPVTTFYKPRISDPTKVDKNKYLPEFCVLLKITPTTFNIAKQGVFEISAKSDWSGVNIKSKTVTINLASGEPTTVELPVDFDSKTLPLKDIRNTTTKEITLEVKYGNRTSTGILKVTQHANNEVPLYIQEADKGILDTKYLSTCFVDETNPELELIKTRAIELKLIKSYSGNANNLTSTLSEVFTAWHYLAEKGIKFKSPSRSATVGTDFTSLKMNTPAEMQGVAKLDSIDGSIFMASFAMNIGLDPILIIKPGHMCVAIRNSAKQYVVLETTTLGDLEIAADWSAEQRLAAIKSNFEAAQKAGLEVVDHDFSTLDRELPISRYYPAQITPELLANNFQFIDVKEARYSGFQRVH